ncbi:GmrSD restriction endonuclease domain-containing protein [Enterococcus innesii]|uniref:GmrSD restriction endonuclease domain-containing protein n=1 Tax=Enterococcus innesii TaxID=2839759 RepID=UPI0034A43678
MIDNNLLDVVGGQTLTFLDLLKLSKVEIPIVQRDYAQGRLENKRVLQEFLEALKLSLQSNQEIKLDFIYGNRNFDVFQPLDGQQRLTTLFLLHWYAAIKENKLTGEPKEILSNFSYETRISSREFCKDLIGNSITLDEDSKLSLKIIDSNWFFLSWKLDPTINSMLNTIDSIHSEFYSVDNLWEKLSKMNLIKFNYLTLKDFGLSDDLYIKMNARGKLLTSFENFKAGLQKKINTEKWEKDTEFKQTFLLKVDTEWADFFWTNYRKKDSIDEAQMNFIITSTMISTALDTSLTDNVLRQINEDTSALNLLSYVDKNCFEYLYQCYEVYSKFDLSRLEIEFPMWRHQPRESILSTIVIGDDDSGKSSYTQKVLFYAQTAYLLKVDNFEEAKFNDWMRVVRNIVSRASIDKNGKRPDIVRSPDTFHGVVNLINELSEGCSDIYNFLLHCTLKSTYSKEQIEEEKRKAKLIVERPELKKLIFDTEDNDLLRGRISFVLDCIEYKDDPKNINVELMEKVKEVFQNYFSNESGLSDDFRRSMLTIEVEGKYEFYMYWWSYWTVASVNKRKLFANFREIEYFLYSDQRAYLIKLVRKLVEKNYSQIIDEFVPSQSIPNWQVRLIKEPELLKDHCKSKYIAIPEDNSYCYLLKSQRPREMSDGFKVE